jgi:hypothetical protein
MTGRRTSALLALPLVLSLLIPESALGASYIIRADGSGDFPTIQAGVDASASGDVLMLASGTFSGAGNRDVDLLGKTLVIRSQGGDPSSCVIDCSGDPGPFHRAFTLVSGEGSGTALEGLTITHARESSDGVGSGGAVLCGSSSSVRISYCVFEDNELVGVENFAGGGAVSSGGGCDVIGCVFIRNTAGLGGAIFGLFGSIRGCTFNNNSATVLTGAIGLGIVQGAVVESCTFVGNTAPAGGVLRVVNAEVAASNCIFAFNQCAGAITEYGTGGATLECCDIYDNEGGDWVGSIGYQLGTAGNISADPLFCDLANEDYSLETDSPCAADQNPECGLIGAWPLPCSGVPVTRTTWGALKALFGE